MTVKERWFTMTEWYYLLQRTVRAILDGKNKSCKSVGTVTSSCFQAQTYAHTVRLSVWNSDYVVSGPVAKPPTAWHHPPVPTAPPSSSWTSFFFFNLLSVVDTSSVTWSVPTAENSITYPELIFTFDAPRSSLRFDWLRHLIMLVFNTDEFNR